MQKKLDDRSRLTATVSFCAAPTIVANKPSSLISFTSWNRNLLYAWDRYKDEVPQALNLSYFELKRTPERVLVLFYSPAHLAKVLKERDNATFLHEHDYDGCTTVEDDLQWLRNRMSAVFPHEIGVFLGFPIEDVLGYIKNKGRMYLFQRYWKVYHNPDRALRLFASYDRAKMQMLLSLHDDEEVFFAKE
jgi:hypothetical protein